MVIDDLNIEGIAIFPYEAYPVLVVDPYGVLAFSIMPEGMQSVVGRDRQVLQLVGRIEHP
jgi:hypothetical protein